MDTHDQSRYGLAAFLHEKLPVILIAVPVMAFVTLMLAILGTGRDGIILVDAILLLAVTLSFAIEFNRRARFWRELENVTRALDRTRYFAELEIEADFPEGQIAANAIFELAARATGEINELRSRNREQAEYTELWVHEVKTPLAAARLLLGKMHGPDAARLKFELERVERLVEQALYTARSDTLVNDYLIREIALADVVGEACKANMHYLTTCGVAVDIEIDPTLRVFADKSWLAFILSQLITNAAKYDARTITFTACTPDEEGPNACTMLELRDDGCGVPESDVPRVFDRGFTGEVGRSHGSATGMGLFLAARMCAQMGIGIMFASEEGVGSRVVMSFPHDRRRAQAIRSAGHTP